MHSSLEVLPDDLKDKLSKKDMPDWTDPMLATLTHTHFSDPGWIYERKLDGERSLFFGDNGDFKIYSRNKKQQNSFFPEIAQAGANLEGHFIMDGEIVTFDGDVTSFSRLQNRMHIQNPDEELQHNYPVYAYIFDLIYFDGCDLGALPVTARKKVLKDAFEFEYPLRYLPHRKEHGKKYLEEACQKDWEGLIAKEADSKYIHGRSKKWLKFKCGHGQELVIGGYTKPEGERTGFGALLVGHYDTDKEKLHYAGKVGTGYDEEFLKKFHGKLQKTKRKTCPFADFDESNDENITWVSPQYVGEIGFTEWTESGKLRHPRFLGLRKDKDPKDVIKEE